jgi:flagellar hook-associated protein 3 FlgL
MRVNPNLVPNILADLQQSQTAVNIALQEVSTGKRVSQPSDDPGASAAMVQNGIDTANLDQYTQNITSLQTTVQAASSALSSVVSSLTQAVSLGTEGANGTNSASNLQALASQVQGILSSVVSQANTYVNGTYLFGRHRDLDRTVRGRSFVFRPGTPTAGTTARTRWRSAIT